MMRRAIAHLLTRLYLRQWRKRYGAEFEALLLTSQSDLRTIANVAWCAIHERLVPTIGGTMTQPAITLRTILKKPSALLPIAMSLTALAMVLGDVALDGVVRETDEGAVAHLWQILMAGQLPVLAFFMCKWLPRAPRRTLYVLAMQTGAALASMAPVFFLGL